MKIVFLGTNPAQFRTGIDALLPDGSEIVMVSDEAGSAAEKGHIETADVIVGNRLTASHPRPARVRLYQAPAAGTDGIDVSLLPDGATLCNAFGHEQPIAEYVMAALLARHVPLADADRRLRQGQWTYWAGQPGAMRSELGDQTIGLLGYGHIGKAIAKRAKAFGMRVHVANRSPVDINGTVDEFFPLEALEAFMASADAVVVSLPQIEQTVGIVGARALAAMRPTGVIVNVGRGPVIDEAALFDALQSKRIGGAIIDTWYVYPNAGDGSPMPSTLPFQSLDNVVMTPHMSGWTDGTIRRRRQTIVDNVLRLSAGQPLLNVVHRA